MWVIRKLERSAGEKSAAWFHHGLDTRFFVAAAVGGLRVLLLVLLLGGSGGVAQARRVALVIGIEKYSHVAPLTNPEKDARRIAGALGRAQFEVTLLVKPAEVTRLGLVSALRTFRDKAEGAEAAVIYYAGHGVEVEGKNWVLPIDVEADRPADLQDNAIPTKRLMDAVSGAQDMRLVVMDACRDNPFAMASGWSAGGRSIGTRGLARETGSDIGSVLLMAAQPGQKASDGAGQTNSPFANLLAQAIEMPGLRISSLPTQLLRGMRSLGVDQAPDLQGIFANADWQFAPAAAGQGAVVAPAPVKLAPILAVPKQAAPALPVSMFGLTLQPADGPGLIVSAIAAGSPYAGKMQRGDVIARVNGAQPPDPNALFALIRREGTAEVLLNRNGRSIFMTMNLPQERGDE